MPLIFDAERVVTGDFADFVSAHPVLSRSGAEGSKFCWGYGDYGAGAGFAEEGVFGGGVFGEGYGCPKSGPSKLGPYRGETRFGYGYGWAAVADVVSGFDRACGGKGYDAID